MLWLFLAIHLLLSLGVDRLAGLIYRRIRTFRSAAFLAWYLTHGASIGYVAGGLYLWACLYRNAPTMLFKTDFIPGYSVGYMTCAGLGLVLGTCGGGMIGGLVGMARTLMVLVRDR